MKGLFLEALVFIAIMLVVIGVPCVGIALLGRKMINRLGRYPSKTPVIQMSIFIKLIVLEVVSIVMLLGFFRIFSD